jgi:riboflavin kinase/FMN adenylyltransferase
MQNLENLPASRKGAHVAIGSFDGVHRGHRWTLAQMVAAAREEDAPALVVTFYPHPRTVLELDPAAGRFRYLTTLDDRIRLLRTTGVDDVIILPFDRPLSRLPAPEFMDSLQSRLGMRALWCGPDFAVGFRRAGDVPFLIEYGAAAGFQVVTAPPLTDSGGPISSTRIRQALGEGEVSTAADMLGRAYGFTGKVVHGAGRGRKIGMPTANLLPWPEIVVPAYGVYATITSLDDRRLPSVTSIGVRPTFAEEGLHEATVETHILDFDEDLYGRDVRLEFVSRLREERRYEGVEALVAQMLRDVEDAREALRRTP